MKVVEFLIDEEENFIMDVVSIVRNPAIEKNFQVFSDDMEKLHFSNDEYFTIGPALIPDKKIKRLDKNGNLYYGFFSKETIKNMVQVFYKRKFNNMFNIEHGEGTEYGEEIIKDLYVSESWIVEEENDKANKKYNLGVPVGSWIIKLHFDANEKTKELYDKYIKTGILKGFSIEAYLKEKQKYAKIEINKDTIQDYIKEKFESFTDYPEYIKEAAKRGIELNLEVNNKCGTQVGKVRAQQLANGEPISFETIKRMYSYLSRAMTYYDENDEKVCGTISVLLWGGPKALEWSKNKIEEIENDFIQEFVVEPTPSENEEEFISRCMSEENTSFPDEEQRYAVCKSKWDNR